MANNSDTVLVVSARFYTDIAAEMERGAIAALDAAGVKHRLVTVPGALELPAAVSFALRADEMRKGGRATYDAYVALGCVIRGETDHYEHVCNESMRALSQLVLT